MFHLVSEDVLEESVLSVLADIDVFVESISSIDCSKQFYAKQKIFCKWEFDTHEWVDCPQLQKVEV